MSLSTPFSLESAGAAIASDGQTARALYSENSGFRFNRSTSFLVTLSSRYTSSLPATAHNSATTGSERDDRFPQVEYGHWSLEGLADLNRDGGTDLVWRNGHTGGNTLWVTQGSSYDSVDLPTLDPVWSLVDLGDFNADGQTDIRWQNSSTGSTLIWYLNGATLIGTSEEGTPPTNPGNNPGNNPDSQPPPTPPSDLPAEIQGVVWNDYNGNGNREADEAGLANWSIYLDQNQNGQFDSGETAVTTDSSGNYRFADLAPGTYQVATIVEPGWQQTYPASNYSVTLTSGEVRSAIDFGNQSSLAGVTLLPQFTGFSQPTYVTNAGDGSDRLFVVQQGGLIRVIQNGTTLTTPFLDIQSRISASGERGLLSMAFPPDYASKGYFYVYYTNSSGNIVISRFRLTADPNVADANSEEVILTIDHPTFSNHNGGQLAFGPDGYLYIGTGDGGGGGDPFGNAQNPNSLLGKILRIDVESGAATYAIPDTNPFLAATDPTNAYRDEIWALGLRNPWRFSFDSVTGDLYIGDVGQGAVEEIDVQLVSSPGGENYGWNRLEGSQPYNGFAGDTSGFTFPIVEYDHSQGESVTGGFVYRGTDPRLQGVYFYGDFVDGNLWGLRRSATGWENTLLIDTSYGISTFGQDQQGNLYLADYFRGDIYRISTGLLAPNPPTQG